VGRGNADDTVMRRRAAGHVGYYAGAVSPRSRRAASDDHLAGPRATRSA
jgi:hypothetical protein